MSSCRMCSGSTNVDRYEKLSVCPDLFVDFK